MTTADDSIFTYTKIFSEGDMLEYKFVNGDEWGEDESVPPECAQDNNRFLVVPGNDTVLIAVCYGSCDPCEIIVDTVVVTFRVDMSEQTVSANGIHVAGSFQGWDPEVTEMALIGNNIYETEITLDQGVYYEYKFINGNTWDGKETVPSECGVDDGQGGFNRYLTAPVIDSTLADVCFSSCDPCSVGLGDIHSNYNGRLNVYPNPLTDKIYIEIHSESAGILSLILTDPYGRVMKTTENLSLSKGMNKYSMQMNDLFPGIYFLQAKSINGDQVVTQAVKILKKR